MLFSPLKTVNFQQFILQVPAKLKSCDKSIAITQGHVELIKHLGISDSILLCFMEKVEWETLVNGQTCLQLKGKILGEYGVFF